MTRCYFCHKWIPFWLFSKENGSTFDKYLRVVHYTETHYPDIGTDIKENRWYHKTCYYKSKEVEKVQ